jgi:hypothetical protein
VTVDTDDRPVQAGKLEVQSATARKGIVMTEQLHLGLNPVQSGRAEEFERFLAEVVVPAVRAQRPEFDGRWRVMRTRVPAGDVVTYVFMLEGGDLAEDWQLDALLSAQYGQEEADRLIRDWVETFSPLDAWVEGAVASGRESNQLVLTLEPVRLA